MHNVGLGNGGGGHGGPQGEDPEGDDEQHIAIGNGRYDNRNDRGFQVVNYRNINILPFSGRSLSINPCLPFYNSLRRLISVQGKVGDDLLQRLDDVEKLGAEQFTNEDLEELAGACPKACEYDRTIQLALHNFNTGLAHGRVTYGVAGGLDAWRKLHHRYVPLAEDLQNILVRELVLLKQVDEQEVDNLFAGVERIIELYTKAGADTDPIQDKLIKAVVMQHLPDRTIINLSMRLKNAGSVEESQRIMIIHLRDHKAGHPRGQGGTLICLAQG